MLEFLFVAIAVWRIPSDAECARAGKQSWQAEHRCVAPVLIPRTFDEKLLEREFCSRANPDSKSLRQFVMNAEVFVNGNTYIFKCGEF